LSYLCIKKGRWGIGYSKSGPFVSGTTPPVDAGFLNNVENYLNPPGSSKSGVPLMSWFGPYSVGTSYAFFNHNLLDATGAHLTPDLVIIVQSSGSANSLHAVYADMTTLTSTQFKAGCDSGKDTIYGIALKF
jgi:hypothetical protein